MRPTLRATGAAAVAALMLTPAAASAAPKPADTVLRGGTIRTFDAKFSVVRALAVRDGRIVYAGGARGVRRFIGKGTKVQDLRGRTVMPGLGDAHIHVLSGGEQLVTCNLEYAALTTQQFQARIQKCLDDDDAGATEFLRVVNWYRQAMVPAGTDATKADLDALKTERPIIVSSSDGHTTLVNSKALQVAGITATTPDPPSGRIDHGADGEPTGILEDAAGGLAEAKVPPPTAQDTQEAMAAALKSLAAAGVTSVEHQIASREALDAYRALRRQGKLTLRVNAAPDISVEDARADAGAAVKRLVRLRERYETGRLGARPGIRVRAAGELFQDGVLQAPAHTASLLSPYFDDQGALTGDAGPMPYWPDPTMRNLVVRLDEGRVHPAGARHRRPGRPGDARRLRRGPQGGRAQGAAVDRPRRAGRPGRLPALQGARRHAGHVVPVGQARAGLDRGREGRSWARSASTGWSPRAGCRTPARASRSAATGRLTR